MSVTGLFIALVVVTSVWLLFSWLVGREIERRERLWGVRIRALADRGVTALQYYVAATWHYIDRHVIRLSWYYSLHSFLQLILRVVVSVYDYLESWFHHNRQRARALRKERRQKRRIATRADVPGDPHLREIAEHKAETALSEKQKQKLKTKKLERE
jgi:hypothetical protein